MTPSNDGMGHAVRRRESTARRTAPCSASDLLIRTDAPLPDAAPNLPEGITHVWLMGTWSAGDLFHYGDGRWTRESKFFEVAGA